MDGYEVCKLIKSQPATKNAEVLAMTAYPSPENERKILECGARVCMTKPLDLDLLIKEVETSL
jgi:putative two-component system response regulator